MDCRVSLANELTQKVGLFCVGSRREMKLAVAGWIGERVEVREPVLLWMSARSFLESIIVG
jgi:hypothetical protein